MLVLHAGLPKAGSSAIQHGLDRHAATLSDMGVHYAVIDETRPGHREPVTSGNGIRLARYLNPRRRPSDFRIEAFEASFDRLYVSPAHPVSVISSEFLAYAEGDMLQRFRDRVLRGREVKVVGFIRDLYGHARASWMQLVKRGAYTRSFEHFADRLYVNSQGRALRTFVKAFGWASVEFIHYETHAHDIFGTFLGAIGSPAIAAFRPPLVNRSLSRTELEVQLLLNRIHHNKALATAVSDHFLLCRPEVRGARIWRPQVALSLASRFAEDVRWINERYFQDPDRLAIARPETRHFSGAEESYPRVLAEAVTVLGRRLGAGAPAFH